MKFATDLDTATDELLAKKREAADEYARRAASLGAIIAAGMTLRELEKIDAEIARRLGDELVRIASADGRLNLSASTVASLRQRAVDVTAAGVGLSNLANVRAISAEAIADRAAEEGITR
jgi:hypothetical protein